MPRSGRAVTRRRLLGALAAAATSTFAGCQAFDSSESAETITPAAVPSPTLSPGTLLVRYAGASTDGLASRAMTDLLQSFVTANQSVRVRQGSLDGDATAATIDGAVVTLDHVGGALAPKAQADELAILERTWEQIRAEIPVGLAVACYLDRDLVAIPQSIHRLNCLYYNPSVLAEAGVDIETYTTFADLASKPSGLEEVVDTLFAQPLRSPRDRLALWESLLGGRLVSQRQYDQLVTGGVPQSSVPVLRATRDYAAALSMTPDSVREAPPSALLDGVLDGAIGFVRQPSSVAHYLADRPDATYGENWAVTPVFSSPWVVTFVADGFSVPANTADLSTARTFVRYAIESERQRRFNERRGAIPARMDVAASVDHHPFYVEQATDYREASMYARSMADSMAISDAVRAALFEALADFERHGVVDRTADDIIDALASASML